MEVDLSGTVLAFQGTLDCTVVQNVRVSIYAWPQRKSPETLARHVGMVFGNPKLSSVALMFVRDIEVRKKS